MLGFNCAWIQIALARFDLFLSYVTDTEVHKKNSAMNHNFTDGSTQLFATMVFFNYHDFSYVVVTRENPLHKTPLELLEFFHNC